MLTKIILYEKSLFAQPDATKIHLCAQVFQSIFQSSEIHLRARISSFLRISYHSILVDNHHSPFGYSPDSTAKVAVIQVILVNSDFIEIRKQVEVEVMFFLKYLQGKRHVYRNAEYNGSKAIVKTKIVPVGAYLFSTGAGECGREKI